MSLLKQCPTLAYPAGRPDHEIWKYALDHDFSVVTTNARDFIKLLNVDVDPGLIVLRQSGLTRDEQLVALLPVIEHIRASGDDNSCSTSSSR
jgi:hypothetical protein